MPLIKLTAPPGVVTDITDYQAGMRYTNSDKVRFFQGYAEKIGGWTKRFSSSQIALLMMITTSPIDDYSTSIIRTPNALS